MASLQDIEDEANRRGRIRYTVGTNEGNIELWGTGNAWDRHPDGMPKFLTSIRIACGSTYVNFELPDSMLENLVDVIEKFLQRPERQINVRVEVVPPPALAPLEREDLAERVDEVLQIRKRMMEGR